jgi:hypothetical protein
LLKKIIKRLAAYKRGVSYLLKSDLRFFLGVVFLNGFDWVKTGCVAIIISLCAGVSGARAKTLDLRKSTDVDGSTREISFCARPSPGLPGLPGHAFVAYAVISADKGIKFRSLGHTVFSVGDAILSFGGVIPTTGALVEEKYTSTKQECLTIQLNKDMFESAYSAAFQPLAKLGIKFDESLPIQKAYSLAAEDCVQFVVSLAQRFAAQELKVPARTSAEFPLPYLRRFIESN